MRSEGIQELRNTGEEEYLSLWAIGLQNFHLLHLPKFPHAFQSSEEAFV